MKKRLTLDSNVMTYDYINALSNNDRALFCKNNSNMVNNFNNQCMTIRENTDGSFQMRYYYCIKDNNICNSKTFMDRTVGKIGSDIKYQDHSQNCFISTPTDGIMIKPLI